MKLPNEFENWDWITQGLWIMDNVPDNNKEGNLKEI